MTDFENIASHDTVINGFVGRCLITQERNNNPAKRKSYKPSKSVPQHLKAKLGMMFHGDIALKDAYNNMQIENKYLLLMA